MTSPRPPRRPAEPPADGAKPPARRSRGTGRVRIEDVARAAGVSAQSVSRWLRDPTKLAQETGRRVAAAVRDVGYVPNLIAGSLASNRSHVVAILVPTLANPVHAGPVEGLSQALRPAGYQVLVGTTDYQPDTEEALIRAFVARRVDGLVLTGSHLTAGSRRILKAAGIPVVQLWELPASPFDMAVGMSNPAIGARVARHFAERGHRHLAVVGHAEPSDTRSAGRVSGFVAECARLGLTAPRVLEVPRPMAVRDAVPLLVELRRGARPARAVFCTSGQLGIVLLLDARKLAIDVPGELAIVGFETALATVVVPNLSAVRIPVHELGFKAGEMLLRRMAGEAPAQRRVDTGFELILRESS
jgi:LacI family gluconate utilization system Gnt-I transcriptional repressor